MNQYIQEEESKGESYEEIECQSHYVKLSKYDQCIFEDVVFLRTAKKKLKEYWIEITGNDIICYSDQFKNEIKFSHCLKGTYIMKYSQALSKTKSELLSKYF